MQIRGCHKWNVRTVGNFSQRLLEQIQHVGEDLMGNTNVYFVGGKSNDYERN